MQQREPVQTPLRRLGVDSRSLKAPLLLLQGLVSGFILLSHNLVIAQTETAIDAGIAPQSKSNLLIAASSQDYNGAYIDPTNYSIGATRSYKAPTSTRKLSKRSRVAPQRRIRNFSTQTLRTRRRSPMPNIVSSKRRFAAATTPVVRWRALVVTKSGLQAPQRPPATRNPRAWSSNKLVSPLSKTYAKQLGNQNPGLLFPLTIPAPITSLFGWRIHPITGDRRFHAGTDLGAPWGTPVLAAYAGKVAIADVLGGYGLTVVLEHELPSNFLGTANTPLQQTLYGHLSEIFVQPGDWVEQGTAIARVGSTGNSTGPHLHFETRQLTPQGWVAVNPGLQLESALTQLVDALRTAHASPTKKS